MINATGGQEQLVIDKDGYTHKVHKLGYGQSLTVNTGGTIYRMVWIAGGGKGGDNCKIGLGGDQNGGGGGAGEYLERQNININPGVYSIVGGRGGSDMEKAGLGKNGENLTFLNVTVRGGGAGGSCLGGGSSGGSGGANGASSNKINSDGWGHRGGNDFWGHDRDFGGRYHNGGGGGGAFTDGFSKAHGGVHIGGSGGCPIISDIEGTAKGYCEGGMGSSGNGPEDHWCTGNRVYVLNDSVRILESFKGTSNFGNGGGGGGRTDVNYKDFGGGGYGGVIVRYRWGYAILCSIASSSDSTGSFDPNGAGVAPGGDASITFRPDIFFEDLYPTYISRVWVDGIEIPVNAPLDLLEKTVDFTNVNENHTLEVEFKKSYYWKALKTGTGNGTITPEDWNFTRFDTEKEVTFQPNNVSYIQEIFIDGTRYLPTDNEKLGFSKIIPNLNKNFNIIVNFDLGSSLTTTQKNGSQITPLGVTLGQINGPSIVPIEIKTTICGFKITSVTIDGTTQVVDTTYWYMDFPLEKLSDGVQHTLSYTVEDQGP